MKTNIIKWDDSMAVRCLARCQDKFAKKYLPYGMNIKKPVQKKASAEKDYSVDIAKGEWDDFQYAVSNALKKKNQ